MEGFQIDREEAGYFRHFFQSDTGKGQSEHSTIDTAIMVVGALFCRNTFDDLAIKKEADALWQSIDWELALADLRGRKLHMVIEDGKPKANTVTSLFNEYYLLADLIREAQLQKRGESDLIRFQDLPKWKNEGVTLLSDWRKVPYCSFLIQFPFYLSHEGARDPDFAEFVRAQAVADQRASMRWNGIPCYWGNGAGTLPGGVYRANLYSEKSRLAGAANRSDRLLLDALWVGRQSSKIGDEVLCGRDTIHLPCDQRVTLERASSLHDCPLIRRRSDSFWQS